MLVSFTVGMPHERHTLKERDHLCSPEHLVPVLQLRTWKARQLLVSACLSWFIFCSPEQKWCDHSMVWCPGLRCHGEHSSSTAVGLILPQLSPKLKPSVLLRVRQAEPGGQDRLFWPCPWEGFLSHWCNAQLLVWLCWLVSGTGLVLSTIPGVDVAWEQLTLHRGDWSLVRSAVRCRCQPTWQDGPCKSCIKLQWPKKRPQLSPASVEAPKGNLASAWICTADEQAHCSSVTSFCCAQVRNKFLQSLIPCTV